MKSFAILIIAGLSVCAFAQQPTPPPKKNPFAGFGNTGLDRKPKGGPSPVSRVATPVPSSPPATSNTPPASPSNGIALATNWAGLISQGSGGHAMKMKDLRALLSNYGSAEADTGPHPDMTIYEGQRMDGTQGDNCRITYLMPLRTAETLLMKNRSIATVTKAVAPGFPDGLVLHTYDVRAGIYNRLCLITDNAKPDQQVVSLLLKAETANYYPASPPFQKINRDWHTHDYVNTENRGQSDIAIDTRVNDLRGRGHYIIVNTSGGSAPDNIPPPGIVIKPSRYSPKETTTWYVPEPLIKLILFCLDKQLRP